MQDGKNLIIAIILCLMVVVGWSYLGEKMGWAPKQDPQKIEEAQKNGQWHTPAPAAITEAQIAELSALLEGFEPACTNFKAMSLSVKKTYTKAYFDAKTDIGRKKRIAWITDRLNKNLKPM